MNAPLPPEAIDAAADALRRFLTTLPFPQEAAKRALEAAAPAIRAAECERIRAETVEAINAIEINAIGGES